MPPRLRGIFERHAGFAYRSLRCLGVSEADADGALERVFLVAHRELEACDPHYARGWLYAICKRVVRDRPRAKPSIGPAEGSAALAFGQQLLALLPPEQREIFVLYEVEAVPVAEIARALDYPARSVRVLLLEARERVVAEVERLAAETDDE